MSKTTLGFIYSGMVYLAIGISLGVLFYIVPGTQRLYAVHAHINLVGFVVFLIFGIGYHILPRFRGRPLHSERLAWFQLWVANVGLLGLSVINGLVAYRVLKKVASLKVLFGALLAVSTFLFIYNMFRTLATVPAPVKK